MPADVLSAFSLSFVAILVHGACQPFVSPILDRMKMLSLVVICITQYTGIVLAVKNDTSVTTDSDNVLVHSHAALFWQANLLVRVVPRC